MTRRPIAGTPARLATSEDGPGADVPAVSPTGQPQYPCAMTIASPLRPLDENSFDLVVIGSGPAGEKGANQAAYYGHRVALVERRSDPGGAAIAVSGVPVKALRDTAVYLTGGSRRDVFGIGISLAPDLVMNRLRARVIDVVTMMTAAVRENLTRHGVELVNGEASLGPDRTVIVRTDGGGERTLRARVILLATGSRPYHPPDLPFDDPDVHDSETRAVDGTAA